VEKNKRKSVKGWHYSTILDSAKILALGGVDFFWRAEASISFLRACHHLFFYFSFTQTFFGWQKIHFHQQKKQQKISFCAAQRSFLSSTTKKFP